MVVDARGGRGDLLVRIVRPGETFDLKKRKRGRAIQTASG
jgi:hypothetical protein